jgi:hypothetical protein
MSTDKISVYHEWDNMFKTTDLRHEVQIPVSCKEMIGAYTAVKNSSDCYQIRIHDTDDVVVPKHHPSRSILLHIHIIERRCLSWNSHLNEYGEVVDGIKLLCIFTDHILEISLEMCFFEHLGNEKVGFSLEGFRTDFSFHTTHTELLSFTEYDSNESLRCCSVLGAQVELFQLDFIFNDDGSLFNEIKKAFFIIPPTIGVIEIYCDSNFFALHLKIKSTKLQFKIYIYDGKSNVLDDGPDSIFLLKDCERCILTTSNQLKRFQMIGFEIVATMYVCPFEYHDDLPEIQPFIKDLLKLNKYVRNHAEDSDCGSDGL